MKYVFAASIAVMAYVGVPEVLAIDPSGLVTCDGTTFSGVSCDFCKFVEMVEKVVTFLTAIMVILAVILLAVTGLQLAASGGNPGAKELLKERLVNVVIGFVLIVASWVLIDTLLKALVSDAGIRDSWRTPIGELCIPPRT